MIITTRQDARKSTIPLSPSIPNKWNGEQMIG